MKTVYVCRTVDGINLYENIFEGYTLIGTLEVQEPPKKWVKKEMSFTSETRVVDMTLVKNFRNAVLTYEVLEDGGTT